MRFRIRSWLIVLVTLAAIVGAGWSVWRYNRLQTALSRTYRIGADHAPPYYYLQPGGEIEGLAVDILNEAARRSGVRLQWVRVPTTLDDAMTRGLVDLWPAASRIPSRQGRFHFTERWLSNHFCLISLAESGVTGVRSMGTRPIAIRSSPSPRMMCPRYFPKAPIVERTSREGVLESVCSGQAAAGFVEARFLDTALLHRPQACRDARFRIDVVDGARTDLSLMSTFESALAADRLRGEISGLARDGSMSAALEKWAAFSSVDARSIYALEDSEVRNQFFLYGLFGMLLASLILLWQVSRTRSARRLAERAYREAEQANAAKSNFLANMSHEIRTPLNGIIGMTSVVLGSEISEDSRQDLVIVEQSALSLLTILNDILDFSKIESGQLTLESAPFDLHNVLSGALDLFRPRAREKGLLLGLDYPHGHATLFLGDQTRIRQIVLNLIGNAVKFTNSGEVRVSVQQDSVCNGVCNVRISVRDTGIGIFPKDQAKLFQKFSQADASTTRQYGGTGLGLAISRTLAQLMGGSAGFTSEFGKGSTFWVDLPLAMAAPVETDSPPSSESPPPLVLC